MVEIELNRNKCRSRIDLFTTLLAWSRGTWKFFYFILLIIFVTAVLLFSPIKYYVAYLHCVFIFCYLLINLFYYSWLDVRYKKLLCMVDLTKDFFYSYSYHVMRSLQKNLCDSKTGEVLYESMFVWNEFLTRDIRKHLQNTIWTVALVYGFFKQVSIWIML